jgi:hypothetical protein
LLDHRSVQTSKYVDWGSSRGMSLEGEVLEGCFRVWSSSLDSGVEGMVIVRFSQSIVGLIAERNGRPSSKSSFPSQVMLNFPTKVLWSIRIIRTQ